MPLSLASIDSYQSNTNTTISSQSDLACSKAAVRFQAQLQVCLSSSSGDDSHLGVAVGNCDSVEMYEGRVDSQNSDVLSTTIDSLGNMTIDDKPDEIFDQKNEKYVNLMCQIRELDVQLKQHKEWAQEKAIQAARKLSKDFMELKLLRMERDETLRMKKGKQVLEDTTMKRLSEMENALRKASNQVDHANAAVRRLETENAEIRADLVASKLSASESVESRLKIAKKEKKCLTLEKQKNKLQEEVAEENKKISLLREQLQLVIESQNEAEKKWKEELTAKELVFKQLEELRSMEAANSKTRQDVLRHKIEVDCKRYEDDIQRLLLELSHLKASPEATRPIHPTNAFAKRESDTSKRVRETNLEMLHDKHKIQETSRKEVGHNRECIICMRDEVSVVFLPCAHQVLCVGCNENHKKVSETNCPCCSIQIEERIFVYGVASKIDCT